MTRTPPLDSADRGRPARSQSRGNKETMTTKPPTPWSAAVADALGVPPTALDTYPVNSSTIVAVRTALMRAEFAARTSSA
jgi:hypothetical protein